MSSHVSILLLGSGWTSQFLLPLLKTSSIPYAYTKRSPSSSDAGAIPFEAAKEGEQQDASAFQSLPRADMVVIIFPLTSKSMVDGIVGTYEEVKECQPAWLALGSTSAWSKGFSTSSTPILETNTRAMAESSLLSLDNKRRRTAVLNLSGLYGGNRDPSNFAKKVGDTMEKLEGKTSLHLVHGKDVALAIIGMWEALKIPTRRDVVWGKRWIVTDTHVYDWWQLFTTLRPSPNPESCRWVKELTKKHSISSLPRPVIGQGNEKKHVAPYILDRALEGNSFWQSIGKKPQIGRCDDYEEGGGGREVQRGVQSREAL